MGGTLMMARDGLVPIEEIELGDEVLSRDETTFELTFMPVVHLFRFENRETVELVFEGQDGGEPEVVITTSNHPFMTPVAGFVPAGELEVGSQCVQPSRGGVAC